MGTGKAGAAAALPSPSALARMHALDNVESGAMPEYVASRPHFFLLTYKHKPPRDVGGRYLGFLDSNMNPQPLLTGLQLLICFHLHKSSQNGGQYPTASPARTSHLPTLP